MLSQKTITQAQDVGIDLPSMITTLSKIVSEKTDTQGFEPNTIMEMLFANDILYMIAARTPGISEKQCMKVTTENKEILLTPAQYLLHKGVIGLSETPILSFGEVTDILSSGVNHKPKTRSKDEALNFYLRLDMLNTFLGEDEVTKAQEEVAIKLEKELVVEANNGDEKFLIEEKMRLIKLSKIDLSLYDEVTDELLIKVNANLQGEKLKSYTLLPLFSSMLNAIADPQGTAEKNPSSLIQQGNLNNITFHILEIILEIEKVEKESREKHTAKGKAFLHHKHIALLKLLEVYDETEHDDMTLDVLLKGYEKYFGKQVIDDVRIEIKKITNFMKG